jgi:two-component system, NarL family, invasion response regulator UvrY
MLRSSMEQRMSGQPDLHIVGDSMDGETALGLIEAVRPDVALIEDHLPVMSGRELAERIREEKLETKVILLLPPGTRERLSEDLQALADSLLFSDDNPAHIVRAVRTVLSGRRFICPLLGTCNACDGFGHIPAEKLDQLSELERDILGLMAEQQSAHQIARFLGINYRDLHRHREAICDKLGVEAESDTGLQLFVVQHQSDMQRGSLSH